MKAIAIQKRKSNARAIEAPIEAPALKACATPSTSEDVVQRQPSHTTKDIRNRFFVYNGRGAKSIIANGQRHETDELINLLVKAHALDERRLITTEELSDLLRVMPQTIAKWRSTGISNPPPAIHVGKNVRYDLEEVLDWAYNNKAH